MYFRLTKALKHRIVEELRRFWQYHPKYPDLPNHIQGKYSFEERPSYGIVVKSSGGTRVDLSADNYVGIVHSYVFLTKVKDYPGVAVEWVREDVPAIQSAQGRFPTAPGVYFIDLTEDDEFYVDSLLDVRHAFVTMTDASTGQLAHAPLQGSLRLFEMPSGFLLQEGEHYTLSVDGAGEPTGEIQLAQPLTGGRTLVADYRYPGPTTGPHKLVPYHANNTAIPGVVLAFGNRNKKGDRQAVVVQATRQPAALEYGGRWDLSFDVDVIARDVAAQEEIADSTVIYLWGVLRSRLSSEGIEMTDLSLGGESEEVHDENGDDYFYNSSFSMTLQTDWSIHVPLSLYLRQVSPLAPDRARALMALPDEQVHEVESSLQAVEALGLQAVVDPFFRGRTQTFEMVR